MQRAAIELALNLLATNQEQHRPLDRFRRVELPPRYQPPPKEFSLCLPLEPWERPVEQDPSEITKLMLRYRKQKDNSYHTAREDAADMCPGFLEPPINYNGPCTLLTQYDLHSRIAKRHKQLVQVQDRLIHACKLAPRTLIYKLINIINEALLLPGDHPSRRLVPGGDGALVKEDLEVLGALCAPSWSELQKPYPSLVTETESLKEERARLEEFEKDVGMFMDELPLWEPLPSAPSPDQPEVHVLGSYNPTLESATGWDLNTLVEEKINKNRAKRESDPHPVHQWAVAEAITHLTKMHNACRIQ